MTETTKQRLRKKASRTRTGPDWDQAYVDSFLEKYCADPAPVEAKSDHEARLEEERLANMTERERIIAQELTAKLELDTPVDAVEAPPAATPKSGAVVVTLAYLSILLAAATSAFVLLTN